MPWLLGIAIAVRIATAQVGADRQTAKVADTLQRHALGESVQTTLRHYFQTPASFRDFVAELKRESRRLSAPVAATFALDAASVAFEYAPRTQLRPNLPGALDLLELGCSRLRESSPAPSEFERHWQVLAADLIIRSTRRSSGSAETSERLRGPYDEHFTHARKRSPADRRLAVAFARYQMGQFYVWRLTEGFTTANNNPVKPGYVDWGSAAERLLAVISDLAPLLDDGQYGDEARVRSGDALLHLNRDREGMALLSDRMIRAPAWEYLQHLVLARSLMQRGQASHAAREYAAALLVTPGARTASLALAGLAYLDGQPAGSDRLARTAAAATGPDPWIAYMYPPAKEWEAEMEELRKQARAR